MQPAKLLEDVSEPKPDPQISDVRKLNFFVFMHRIGAALLLDKGYLNPAIYTPKVDVINDHVFVVTPGGAAGEN